MNRGILFKIPNEQGYHLQQILAILPIENYYWRSGGEESYIVENGELATLLFEQDKPFTGHMLKEIVNQQHYLIFVNLKAFTQFESVQEIETYDQFLESDCELIVLIIDSSDVAIFTKDQHLLYQLYEHVIALHYKMVEFITEQTDGFHKLTIF